MFAEVKILEACSQKEPIGFNEIIVKTDDGEQRVSPTTLTKYIHTHLNNEITKVSGESRDNYTITPAGTMKLEELRNDLPRYRHFLGTRKPKIIQTIASTGVTNGKVPFVSSIGVSSLISVDVRLTIKKSFDEATKRYAEELAAIMKDVPVAGGSFVVNLTSAIPRHSEVLRQD